MRAPVKQVRPLITLTDASGQQSTMDTNTTDKSVVTPQILSYYSELKMWTVDKEKTWCPVWYCKEIFLAKTKAWPTSEANIDQMEETESGN